MSAERNTSPEVAVIIPLNSFRIKNLSCSSVPELFLPLQLVPHREQCI